MLARRVSGLRAAVTSWLPVRVVSANAVELVRHYQPVNFARWHADDRFACAHE